MNKLFNANTYKILPSLLLVSGLILPASNAVAETFKASSAKYPVALVELYTSQGCSSCPPAERWLGGLEDSGIKADSVVPLALHVDYWDYIGWKDQYAQKYFTTRQYQYEKTKHSKSVYTPQIIFNGKDVRGQNLSDNLSGQRQKISPVAFNVKAETNNNRLKVAVDFSKIDTIAKNSNVVLVVAENGLVDKIKSGENAGRTLTHEHVVRVWKNLGKIRNNFALDVNLKPDWKKDNLELVIIVETNDMQTQQALQLALK